MSTWVQMKKVCALCLLRLTENCCKYFLTSSVYCQHRHKQFMLGIWFWILWMNYWSGNRSLWFKFLLSDKKNNANHIYNFNFLVNTLKKEKEIGEVNFNSFFLTEHIQNVIMSTSNKHRNWNILHSSLFVLILWNLLPKLKISNCHMSAK